VPNALSTLYLVCIFFAFAVAVPLVHILFVLLLWFLPLTRPVTYFSGLFGRDVFVGSVRTGLISSECLEVTYEFGMFGGDVCVWNVWR
jgi:hypothetical protein